MSATGYEETELTYNVNEEEQQKVKVTILYFPNNISLICQLGVLLFAK